MKKEITLTEQMFYILLTLCEPMHGYGVMMKVAEMTAGRIKLGAGTLYGAFNNLQKSGLIHFVGVDEENSRRKIYETTENGRLILISELNRLEENVKNAKEILYADGEV
ncbi:MAG TPA: helix-turn-helix transcriptional regulator [Thermotogota bacterium]|nr:helix-turn-helix transcriptional regulator [Thermotogota bacterium]HPJ89598.1 helix-turn-helix transcriptional regulator [Thermotogota bacterium]HPR96781.1 helix-turn-helix transcriptional regulator [Thermotogota bacterium]